MNRVSKFFAQALILVSAACLLVMSGVMCWQVIARYWLESSPSWAEQLCLLLLIWFVLLAAAVGVRESTHIEVAVLRDALPPRLMQPVQIFARLVVAMFGLALIVGGWALLDITSQHVIPGLGISRSLAYWPLLISGVAMIFFTLEQLMAIHGKAEIHRLWN